ncbi:hypothetical protein ZIOFF_004222 [Zingiber officinale]|uniref:AP180 N-terminal homology (ANTH) domain-containing protein n=1 Tax=Zingiber officinale TaxID=94328 RepID=A0A8J5LU21_ZINOF|nr:hypothetical protein ZIOFF_004222 [Zingiber officinale]
MQILPYADGMEVELILEAMYCVVIEIFEVYSGICNGIARFLIGVRGSDSGNADERVKCRRETGIQILRRAAEHSAQLSSYFDHCRTLGVLNAADLPRVEGTPENDMDNLKVLMLGDAPTANAPAAEDEGKRAIAEPDSATAISGKRNYSTRRGILGIRCCSGQRGKVIVERIA